MSINSDLLKKYNVPGHRYTSYPTVPYFPIHRGHVLNEEDRVLRRHILNLMTRFSTEWSQLDAKIDYLQGVSERLSELARDGLVELTDESCHIAPEGRALLRNICMAFDARLSRQSPQNQLFSKTI